MELMDLAESNNDLIEIKGQDPVLDTPFLIGDALAGALGTQAAAVTQIWKMRGSCTKWAASSEDICWH